MADQIGDKYKSCDDNRLGEIIFDEGDLKKFNMEYWHPELNKYKDFRHEDCMNNLRLGTRHHLKVNFEDNEFTDGDENLYYNS